MEKLHDHSTTGTITVRARCTDAARRDHVLFTSARIMAITIGRFCPEAAAPLASQLRAGAFDDDQVDVLASMLMGASPDWPAELGRLIAEMDALRDGWVLVTIPK